MIKQHAKHYIGCVDTEILLSKGQNNKDCYVVGKLIVRHKIYKIIRKISDIDYKHTIMNENECYKYFIIKVKKQK